MRSRYPQGNRKRDYAYQAVMLTWLSGKALDDARAGRLNHGKLPCVL
ncbi:hypothetical protein [Cylindrospermum stagnale]|nr:hypothetical protein [Cylindrospermum stagnale]